MSSGSVDTVSGNEGSDMRREELRRPVPQSKRPSSGKTKGKDSAHSRTARTPKEKSEEGEDEDEDEEEERRMMKKKKRERRDKSDSSGEEEERKKKKNESDSLDVSAEAVESCPTRRKGDDHTVQVSPRHCPARKRKLLILDVNGVLADIRALFDKRRRPDVIISNKAVFKRPFCRDFLQFCFVKFDVGIWSSRTRKNLDWAVDILFGKSKRNLLFCWDQSQCTKTGFGTIENGEKPLVLKELKWLWETRPWEWRGGDYCYYDESNTVLLDDSPYKALRNPPHSSVFPFPYRYDDVGDDALGPEGSLRAYLEGLASADDVPGYVLCNPFGQEPVTRSSLHWTFYQKVLASLPLTP